MKVENIHDLTQLLSLEQVEENYFLGKTEDHGGRSIFGGQVLAQCVIAAYRTIPDNKIAHSLHAYFLLAGDLSAPVLYEVDRIRDGKSFSTRRIKAIQHGRPILNMSISFNIEEPGMNHQESFPETEHWSKLQKESTLRTKLADRIRKKDPKEAMRILRDRPFETRPVYDTYDEEQTVREPHNQYWIRATTNVDPKAIALHHAMIAYVSDWHLMSTALLPHEKGFATPGFQGASLDHSMYFLRKCSVNEWLLYDLHSPSASNSRGLNFGKIYNEDGVLIAVAIQEGLMRIRKPKT